MPAPPPPQAGLPSSVWVETAALGGVFPLFCTLGETGGNPFLQKGKWGHGVISLGQSCLIEVSACAVLYGSHWI